jgi:hypothetical protein
MGAVFLSYRREDASGTAGRLFDRLRADFGAGDVFMDVDSIEPGLDFVDVVNRRLDRCDVLLAVIGPGWLDAKDRQGRRRLDDEFDFVRLEISRALERGIRVIPVLVEGAAPVATQDLPDDLKALARRHAVEVRHDRFRSDADALIQTLRNIVQPDVSGAWTGKVMFGEKTFPVTWVLNPNGSYHSLNRDNELFDSGTWRMEVGELQIRLGSELVYRGSVVGDVLKGTFNPISLSGTGSFEMRRSQA